MYEVCTLSRTSVVPYHVRCTYLTAYDTHTLGGTIRVSFPGVLEAARTFVVIAAVFAYNDRFGMDVSARCLIPIGRVTAALRRDAHRPVTFGYSRRKGKLQFGRRVRIDVRRRNEYRRARLFYRREKNAYRRVIAFHGEAHSLNQDHLARTKQVGGLVVGGGIENALDNRAGRTALFEDVDGRVLDGLAGRVVLRQVDGHLNLSCRKRVPQVACHHDALQRGGGAEQVGYHVVPFGEGVNAFLDKEIDEGFSVDILCGNLAFRDTGNDVRRVESISHLRGEVVIVRYLRCKLIQMSDGVNLSHNDKNLDVSTLVFAPDRSVDLSGLFAFEVCLERKKP